MKISLEITDPALKTALEYFAKKEGHPNIEAYCLNTIQATLASEDERIR